MTHHNGRRYLIFAATSGIGADLVHRLAAAGARLALAARNAAALKELAATVDAAPYPYDAGSFASAEAAAAGAVGALGGLDGVVCLSGSLLLKPAHLTTEAEWAQTVSANATAAFGVIRATARLLGSTGGGSIVLVSSAAARIGLPNHEAIAAAKAAVEGLALSAAASYARQNVRINCVAPGLIRTPLTKAVIATEAGEKASTAMHPLGRLGEAADPSAAIAWLLSQEAAWVTGQVLGVDGGLGRLKTPARG